MILQAAVILESEPQLHLEREESGHAIHPTDAIKTGFYVPPQSAALVIRILQRAGHRLVDDLPEVMP